MAELLTELNGTIALTTYQAGKLILISALNKEEIVQLPRQYDKAMGLAVRGSKMAVATKDEVQVLASSNALALHYGKTPGMYDTLFLPRATYYSGEIDLHDMAWGNEGLWGVNTRFSCLCLINDEYSFENKWTPFFVSDQTPDDRCHLNGMAMLEGRPAFVTALGATNVGKAWRENILEGGVILDVDSNEIVINGLPMPHSPRIFDGKLYALSSARGEIICIDTNSGKYEVVTKVQGFLRGMCRKGDVVFVGLSKLRQNASTFRDLPIARESIFSGVVAIHLPSGKQIGYIKYENSVEEIYDVQFLDGMKRPGILNTLKEEHRRALVTNTDAYWSSAEAKE
ncbi:MAG: TIGR03032 family protein [Cytophagaceae bacterium]|jgi:uncharacterized protein (TIGR03032 family)|nr:TIGR03032 family protein [Cytophagaceae bacterium]